MTDVDTPEDEAIEPADQLPRRQFELLRSPRAWAMATSVVVVALAALLVPMPYVQHAPGSARVVASIVSVGEPTTELTGSYRLLSVRVGQPSLVATVIGLLDDDVGLEPRGNVIPDSMDSRTYFAIQAEQFAQAFDIAAAAALRAAGLEVTVVTVPMVANVREGAPADGVLEVGDVVLAVDGLLVSTPAEVVAIARGATDGQVISLRVDRGGATLDLEVTAGQVPGLDGPGMGISLETRGRRIDLPREVELVAQDGMGGPSAGLMVALTVYDLVADEDLARGRTIAGTGTIDADGQVGRIGSLRAKVLTAIDAGADVMLVEDSQASEAERVADGRLQVIGVHTLTDAIESLRR